MRCFATKNEFQKLQDVTTQSFICIPFPTKSREQTFPSLDEIQDTKVKKKTTPPTQGTLVSCSMGIATTGHLFTSHQSVHSNLAKVEQHQMPRHNGLRQEYNEYSHFRKWTSKRDPMRTRQYFPQTTPNKSPLHLFLSKKNPKGLINRIFFVRS